MKQLLKVRDVASLLNVRPSTVYQWVSMDYIPHVRLGVGQEKPCVRFDEQTILDWVQARTNQGRTSRLPQAS
jgi:excisionase family DNA binding protein